MHLRMIVLGYGHIAPKTVAGKMFCIVYSLIGIPILLVFMAKIGDRMADIFRWTYRSKNQSFFLLSVSFSICFVQLFDI
jgi:NADH:ubiquinone oxidoreductase subunit 2 (subunit N)